MKKNLILLLSLLIFFSCKTKNKKVFTTTNKQEAKYFTINNFDKFKVIKIKEAWPNSGSFNYILSKNKKNIPDSLKNYTFIKIPLQKVIVTSTTHLSVLEVLNQTDKLVGFPNTKYISSQKIKTLVKQKKITDVGNGIGLNTEKTILLKPDLIIAFSSGKDQKQYEVFKKNNIPVFFNADWMENHPLGRAEWIKIFGILFQKEKTANKIFNKIKQNYYSIKNQIQSKKNKPEVFQGGIFGDKWYVPGGKSYAVQLIKDAGGKYIWEKNTHTGSISLNFENVLLKLSKINIWLNPGNIVSLKTLSETIPQIKNTKVFKHKRIYTYTLKKGKTGGLIYFENSNIHPDWILDDLFHIFYPSNNNYKFHYYSQLLP